MITQPNYAGFWIRLIAALIDGFFLLIFSWVLFYGGMYGIYLLMGMSVGWGSLPPFEDAFDSFLLQFYFLILYSFLEFIYFTWGHARFGSTFGKWVFKLKVVSAIDHSRFLTLKESMLRFFGYLVSYLPLGAGYLMAGFHPEKKALHDIMAKSVVFKGKTRGSLSAV